MRDSLARSSSSFVVRCIEAIGYSGEASIPDERERIHLACNRPALPTELTCTGEETTFDP
jgi:hypothetical protein